MNIHLIEFRCKAIAKRFAAVLPILLFSRLIVILRGGCGVYVTLRRGSSIVKGLQVCVNNDNVAQDPILVALEASNEVGVNLTFGHSWTPIYNGSIGFEYGPPRFSCSLIRCIDNSIRYTSYRFLVTKKRRMENSVQYSEVQFFDY
ncbi:hypothetical protein I4U23_022947 [Adineta vaga]|nr:hypothetical protein I4U23_022947 [Adineta vaga]